MITRVISKISKKNMRKCTAEKRNTVTDSLLIVITSGIYFIILGLRSVLVTTALGWAVWRSVTEKSIIDVWRNINFVVFC